MAHIRQDLTTEQGVSDETKGQKEASKSGVANDEKSTRKGIKLH